MQACPGPPPCAGDDDTTFVDVPLTMLGIYRIVALTSGDPIPAPQDGYDKDIARARRAGATCIERQQDVN